MTLRSWFRSLTTTHASNPRQRCRPMAELLEDRAVSAGFACTDFSNAAGLSLLGAAAIIFRGCRDRSIA